MQSRVISIRVDRIVCCRKKIINEKNSYVFWKNPLNYVGLAVTTIYETYCRIMFKLYGKNVKILSKKIAAIAYAAE